MTPTKPLPRAALAWTLVALAAAALAAGLMYRAALADVRGGVAEARPPQQPSERRPAPPTLFGTVLSFDGTTLKVDSKQPFGEVAVDAETAVRSAEGSEIASSGLVPGATVTASGRDLGDGRMAAYAIVLLRAP